ncbi:unnamed protein product [Vitrella brassicaformis CCMP3155]|uniref:Generative cell specific-1/HAP2 domain-containing protein n=1 Tax=Vitrella brassicaformis (strain CCMP3155) TaxID=1169540 RepID=A0A0G4FGZ2_VITBC|nr:unnamed protein product [Vitrella brassicaformis CCMP3155]|eukprot:CEM12681.1 unnamed protein product [Vitrella brassicaformis CCMP3155]
MHPLQLPLLLVLQAAFQPVSADLISSSKVEKCIKTSVSDLDCTEKLVLLLNINTGEGGSEYLELGGVSVEDTLGDGERVNLSFSKDIRVKIFKEDVLVSYPLVYIQDVYDDAAEVQNFDNRRAVGGIFSSTDNCETDEMKLYRKHTEDNTWVKDNKWNRLSCGVLFKDEGEPDGPDRKYEPIPSSGGFCCFCDNFDAAFPTIEWKRGLQLECWTFNSPWSCHAMRYGEEKSEIYRVQTHKWQWSISITMYDIAAMYMCEEILGGVSGYEAKSHLCCPKACGECGNDECDKAPGGATNCCAAPMLSSNRNCSSHAPPCVVSFGDSGPSHSSSSFREPTAWTATINPNRKVAEAQSIIVKYQGSLLPDDGVPTWLEDKYVVWPAEDSTGDMLRIGDERGPLILDQSHFDLTGAGCDKIGITYEGFKLQPDRCSAKKNTCTGRNPNEYRKDDLDKPALERNWLLRYRVEAESILRAVSRTNFTADRSARSVTFKWLGDHSSLITLEAKADSLRWVLQLSPGRIVGLRMADFEALKGGDLVVIVQNTGKLTAEYEIGVSCCWGNAGCQQIKQASSESNDMSSLSQEACSFVSSSYLLHSGAKQVTLSPQATREVTFRLNTETELGGAARCTVGMLNQLAATEDRRTICFNITATESTLGQQEEGEIGGLGAGDYKPDFQYEKDKIYVEVTCRDICPSFWALACFVDNLDICLSRLGPLVGVTVLLAVLGCCLICFRNYIFYCIAALCRGARGMATARPRVTSNSRHPVRQARPARRQRGGKDARKEGGGGRTRERDEDVGREGEGPPAVEMGEEREKGRRRSARK